MLSIIDDEVFKLQLDNSKMVVDKNVHNLKEKNKNKANQKFNMKSLSTKKIVFSKKMRLNQAHNNKLVFLYPFGTKL